MYILLKQIFQSSKGNSDKNVDLDCEQLDYYEHVCCKNVHCEHMDYYEHVCCKNVHCDKWIIMNMYVVSMVIVNIHVHTQHVHNIHGHNQQLSYLQIQDFVAESEHG